MTRKKAVNPILPGRYARMSREELDAEVSEFDKEFIVDRAVPLTEAMKAKLRKARRRRGRSAKRRGALQVSVTVERDLMRRADALRKKKRMTRAQLFAQGLEALLTASE